MYRQFKSGYLMETGGLDDQPAKLMRCIRLVDNILSEIEQDRQEKQDRESRKAARKGRAGRRR